MPDILEKIIDNQDNKKISLSEKEFNNTMTWYHHHILEEALKNGPADLCNHKLKFSSLCFPTTAIKQVRCSCGAVYNMES